jgi:hypothetical protein
LIRRRGSSRKTLELDLTAAVNMNHSWAEILKGVLKA